MAKGRKTGGRKPGSRNKATAEVKELARNYAPEAFASLVQIAKSGSSEAARVAAIREILDRAYGKAPQAITGDGDGGPVKHVLEVLWGSTTAAG